MSKQDESYLDSLLESFSVSDVQERPAATKKSKKNIEMTAEEETVVAEPESEVETIGLDSLEDLDDLDLGNLDLDLDLDMDLDLDLGEFAMDEIAMDEIAMDEVETIEEPELDFVAEAEFVSEPELDFMAEPELTEEVGSVDEDDILALLGQVDADNSPDESDFADEISLADEISFGDEPGVVDEIGLADEISFGDESDMVGEIGLSDEIGLADEISFGNESDMIGEIGLSDEIGLADEISFGMDADTDLSDFDFMSFAEGDFVGSDEIGLSDVDEAAEIEEAQAKKKDKEAKKRSNTEGNFLTGLFHKLFDNVPVETKGADASELLPDGVEADPQEAEEAKRIAKEQKAAARAEKKAAQKAEKEAKKKESETRKKAKQEEKKAKKAEAARLAKEVAEPEETGRINRAGAAVVAVLAVAMILVLVFGSQRSAYALSIWGAEREFSLKHYSKAYQEISGLEIRPKDMGTYDKIMTVMYVNKQLNSYNNFYAMGKYPQALDSLLKGLERYDKYLALARELSIESDMNYVRDQILGELERVYFLTERDAVNLTEIEDIMEYSTKVYELASNVQPEPEEEYVP